MNIILCGYHWTGCRALDLLLARGCNVFVYTHASPWHIANLADQCEKRQVHFSLEKISINNIPFKPDMIASIYYKYIIDGDVIQYVNNKIFNLHPALLPSYRGCSSVTWALINGESEYGFTYHYVEPTCDTGSIILQLRIRIEDYDTQQSLYHKVMFESMRYFNDVFDLVADGFHGTPQNGISSYYPRGCPFNGEISDDWTIEQVERFIRAMCFPPYNVATYKGKEVRSLKDYLLLRGE